MKSLTLSLALMALGLRRCSFVAQRHIDHVAEEYEPANQHHCLPGPCLCVLLHPQTRVLAIHALAIKVKNSGSIHTAYSAQSFGIDLPSSSHPGGQRCWGYVLLCQAHPSQLNKGSESDRIAFWMKLRRSCIHCIWLRKTPDHWSVWTIDEE